MPRVKTTTFEFDLSQEGGDFWFFVEDIWDDAVSGRITREELVQLKTMIEEALNGSGGNN